MHRTVITYGTFDLFHIGHKRLLEHAKELGDYLIVGVTSDAFDQARGKLDVRESLADRIHSVEKTGIADKIIVEEYKGQKIEDIRRYNVDVFAVGSDWIGKFDYLKDYCEVVYLPRTEGISSTQLRLESAKGIRLACVGSGEFTNRIIRECSFLSEGVPVAICNSNGSHLAPFDSKGQFETASSFDGLSSIADAVYVYAPPHHKSALIDKALESGLNVLCEGPISYSINEAVRLFDKAESNNLVLMEAFSVLFQPGFQRLKLLLESGIIGEIKDIDASFSMVPTDIDYSNRFDGSYYRMLSRTLLPALVFLGSRFSGHQIICGFEEDYCTWTKCNLTYPASSATLKTGRGIKTEGDMTITGTNGYIYVPSPWWLLEYFEVRGEDLRKTRKHYYELAGEGQRYLLRRFFDFCNDRKGFETDLLYFKEIELSVVSIIEEIIQNRCIRLDNNSKRFGGGETIDIS